MLIPTPNYLDAQRTGNHVEANRAYALNPAASSPAHLRQYEFLGILIGCALRTHVLMPFNLPNTVWRFLVGLPLRRIDLLQVDKRVYDTLNSIATCTHAQAFDELIHHTLALDRPLVEEEDHHKHSNSNKNSSSNKNSNSNNNNSNNNNDNDNANVAPTGTTRTGLLWTWVRSDGVTQSMLRHTMLDEHHQEQGAGVSYDDRLNYVATYETARLQESRMQAEALGRGLQRMVPSQLLRLYTPSELQRMVCGRDLIDLDLLKRHTVFGDKVNPKDNHIEYFWNVLASFTQEERKRFIQFTYAQRRLPSNDEEWRSSRTAQLRIKMYRFPEPKQETSGRRRRLSSRARQQRKAKPMTKRLYQVKMDQQLPTAQTCFFDLYLPSYSTEAIMKQRLLTAINFQTFEVEDVPRVVVEEEREAETGGGETKNQEEKNEDILKEEKETEEEPESNKNGRKKGKRKTRTMQYVKKSLKEDL